MDIEHDMNPEDPCFTCALRTAAALGWTLETPVTTPPPRCARLTEPTGYEEETVQEEACSSTH